MLPQVSIYIAMSLDGFIATRENGLDWLRIVEATGQDYGYAEFMSSVDALVMGRNTYDVVRGFETWPYEGKKVVVMTHRPLQPARDEGTASGPLRPVLERLLKSGVRRVYLDGGKTVQAGLGEGVVTDLTISVIPILLGDGIPLFGKLDSQIRLEALGAERFETGLVQLKYRIRI